MTQIAHLPRLVVLLAVAFTLCPPMPAAAQEGPCGVVDSIQFPVETATMEPVYRFGLASSRYDGRLHAGEDWFGGRGSTYGTPVRAIARGRVTYSAPLGWGLDKGVVILEHLMPDGTWWYSMYGHMEEVGDYTFPTVYTCVDAGQIIGAIGRPRPAPHLHLEIRNFGPDSPGPGYWGTDPTLSGWREPSRFITNWQAWLSPAHRWHGEVADTSGPHFPAIQREDGVLIVFDDNRLKALTTQGQILWRYILGDDRTITGVLPDQGAILVVDSAGLAQTWSLEGGYIDQWELGHNVDSQPVRWDNLLIMHSGEGNLIAYAPDRSEVWRAAGIPRPTRIVAGRDLLGVAGGRNLLTLLSLDGQVISQTTLRGMGDLAPAPDGGLYVRSATALWHVTPEGRWRWLGAAPTVQPSTSSLISLADGRFFLFSGSRDRLLRAYSPEGRVIWETSLDAFEGRPFILSEGSTLFLADGYGHIATVGLETGALCRELRVWGSRGADAWAGIGPDGVLRVHIADEIVGLDWGVLSAGCR